MDGTLDPRMPWTPIKSGKNIIPLIMHYRCIEVRNDMTDCFQRFQVSTIVFLAIMLMMVLCIVPVSGLSVSGAKYVGSISPGGTDTHIITITIGSGDSATDMIADVRGFGQDLDQSYKLLGPADDISPYSARSFITLDNSSLHVEPGMSKEITAKITIPQNAGAGGRYALIYLHPIAGTGQTFTTGAIIPVLITITGTTPTETGTIATVDVGNVVLGQPITIATAFKNTGNYHYYHTVNVVTVTDASGNIISNASTQPSVYAIIPGNTVQYTVSPVINNLPIGTYTADSKVLLENGQVLDEKTTTFSVKTNYVPPSKETNITVSPGSAATLTSSDGRYSVLFPQGAVLSNVIVTLKSYPTDKLSPAPSGAKLGATSFEVAGLSGLLSKDATVTVTYSADDLTAAGGDASQLKLSSFDAAQNAWVILPTQADTGSKKLTATTNRMGVFTVMVSSAGAGSPAGVTEGSFLPLPPVLSVIAIAVAAIMVGKTVRRRK
jgi:hypothetical protein